MKFLGTEELKYDQTTTGPYMLLQLVRSFRGFRICCTDPSLDPPTWERSCDLLLFRAQSVLTHTDDGWVNSPQNIGREMIMRRQRYVYRIFKTTPSLAKLRVYKRVFTGS